MKIDEVVKYYSIKNDENHTVHTVTELLPNGIPSCRMPMVKLSDKAGYVLVSHCEVVDTDQELNR